MNLVTKISGIHGQGLFTLEPIPATTRVIEYVGEQITKSESLQRCQANNHFIFALNDQYDLDGCVPWNLARWINHHCEANCEAELINGRLWIVAKREISAGEEITFNYGYDLASYQEHPCHCGSKSCIGSIVAEAFFPLLRQQQLRQRMQAQP